MSSFISGRHIAGGLTALGLALTLAGCGGGSDTPPPPDPLTVKTSDGAVHGAASGAMREFLGIPYAAPPQGDLRWKAPVAPAPWQATREATAFGPHCPQPDTSPLEYGTPGGKEDCLYLNVFTPTTPGPHPVMVWLHGGAFLLGRSNGYNPAPFVAQGNVVVTVNYRLGALGYLAHPAFADATGSVGNYGLLDQLAALKWVKTNAAAFGGDASNVTLFGQSAGAMSVMAHIASPMSAGLFQKAIVQSTPGMAQPTATEAKALASATAATAFGCTDPATAGACLRALSIDAIVAKQPGAFSPVNGPIVDGSFQKTDIATAITSGNYNKVPVIIGAAHDEYTSFQGQAELTSGTPLPAAAYPGALLATFKLPTLANAVAATYPLSAFDSPSLALSAAVGDYLFSCPTRRIAKQFTAAGAKLYMYEFNDANAPMTLQPPVSFPYKAYHASELQYLFDLGSKLSTPQQQLASSMLGMWSRFAATGNPNATGDATWPAYDAQDKLIRFAPSATAVASNFAVDHKCALWTPGV